MQFSDIAGVRSQESGVRSQESGVRSQESGVSTSLLLSETLRERLRSVTGGRIRRR
jgi:hypothetical protein